MWLLIILLDNIELKTTNGRICIISQIHLVDFFPTHSVFKRCLRDMACFFSLEEPISKRWKVNYLQNCAAEYQQMECNRKRKKNRNHILSLRVERKASRVTKQGCNSRNMTDIYQEWRERNWTDIKRKVYICGIRNWNKFKLL